MRLAFDIANASVSGLLSSEDENLIHEACAAWPSLTAADMTRDALKEVAEVRGIDHATALFYARLCEAPEQQEFFESLIKPELPQFTNECSLIKPPPKILYVPAALYREFPSYRGDGRDFIAAGLKLGLETEVVPVASTGGLRENALILARVIERQTNPHLVLATVSKGGADARFAFDSGLIPPGRIQVWLQMGGLLRGTPLASSVIHGNWLRRALLHTYLRSRGGSRLLLSDLAHDAEGTLSTMPRVPPGVSVINVLGFPMTRHLRGSSLRRHHRLAPLGPNDAMTLLADAILQPGLVWPLWGCNHYFQIPNIQSLIERVLAYICRHHLGSQQDPHPHPLTPPVLAACP